MDYYAVKSYIRLIGNVTDERGIPKLTKDEIDRAEFKFVISTFENKPEIVYWDFNDKIKKPSVWDLKALISKDDIKREKRFHKLKLYKDDPSMIFKNRKLLEYLIPDLEQKIENFIENELKDDNPSENNIV